MDWTDCDADDQTTLALNLVTNHGRATPLLWLTVFKAELKDKRNDDQSLCLLSLAEALPEGVPVTILADRGFGDVKLFVSTNWALTMSSTMSSGFAAISMSRRTMARPTPPSFKRGHHLENSRKWSVRAFPGRERSTHG